jgi:hypothetical protein
MPPSDYCRSFSRFFVVRALVGTRVLAWGAAGAKSGFPRPIFARIVFDGW